MCVWCNKDWLKAQLVSVLLLQSQLATVNVQLSLFHSFLLFYSFLFLFFFFSIIFIIFLLIVQHNFSFFSLFFIFLLILPHPSFSYSFLLPFFRILFFIHFFNILLKSHLKKSFFYMIVTSLCSIIQNLFTLFLTKLSIFI